MSAPWLAWQQQIIDAVVRGDPVSLRIVPRCYGKTQAYKAARELAIALGLTVVDTPNGFTIEDEEQHEL